MRIIPSSSIKSIISLVGKQLPVTSRSSLANDTKRYRELIKHEASIGGQIFGPVPHGYTREFFCLDRYTWVWHEEWIDAEGRRQSRMTRYDVRPTGILKAQDGSGYKLVSKEEGRNLIDAAKKYQERVLKEVYNS